MIKTLKIIFTMLYMSLVVACGSDDSKPVSKSAVYPAVLYGAWEWPCYSDGDTEDTVRPLFERAKASFGNDDTYIFEITTFNAATCVEGSAVSKSVYKGTYSTKTVFDDSNTPYAEIDIDVSSRTFEGNSLIAATAVDGDLHDNSFSCQNVARALIVTNQLQINWKQGLIDSGILDSNGKLIAGKNVCRYGKYGEILTATTVKQENYLPVPNYNANSLANLVGIWEEGCSIKGTNNPDDIYYTKFRYEITAQEAYIETRGLYDNPTCIGDPIASYKYHSTIAIDTSIGDANGDGIGVAPTNVEGILGLHTIISYVRNEATVLRPGITSSPIPFSPGSRRATLYEIMISSPSSDYLFLYGRRVEIRSDSVVIREIYSRI